MFRRENLVPFISEANSTTTTLQANETFTGVSQYVLGYININLIINCDVTSQSNGIHIEFSQDGVNWNFTTYSSYYTPNMSFSTVYPIVAPCLRLIYTNGSTDQTYFRLHTILYSNDIKSATIPFQSVKFIPEAYDAFRRQSSAWRIAPYQRIRQ